MLDCLIKTSVIIYTTLYLNIVCTGIDSDVSVEYIHCLQILWSTICYFQDEDEGEAELEEEDLYGKAESEFWSIINAEKKNIEKKKEAEMDKADAGKVNLAL